MRARNSGEGRAVEQRVAARARVDRPAVPNAPMSVLALQGSAGNAAVTAVLGEAAQARSGGDGAQAVQRATSGLAPVQRATGNAGAGTASTGVVRAVQRMGNCFSDPSTENDTELTDRSRSAGARTAAAPAAEASRAAPAARSAPNMRDVVTDMVQKLGIPVRALEMELFAPNNVIMSIGFEEPYGGLPVNEALKRYEPEFASICGETANLLRQFTFRDGGELVSMPLTQVIDFIRKPGDANLQITGHGHAFFVEKRGGSCRLMQSYIGKYSLSDSLEGKSEAGSTTLPAADLARRLQDIADHHVRNESQGAPWQTHPDEAALFGGPMFAKQDIVNGVVRLKCAITTDIADAGEQQERIQAQRNLHADAWRNVRSHQGTTGELAMQFF